MSAVYTGNPECFCEGGDENNHVIENGKDFSYPKGRRLRNPASLDSERAIRNPKDFLEPGFPAKTCSLMFY